MKQMIDYLVEAIKNNQNYNENETIIYSQV